MRAWVVVGKLVFAVFVSVMAVSNVAHAQATRTWVSGVGDDANPCNRTAPCKTFAGAISKTAAGGEINVLDAGAYGAVTITKSISIIAERFTAGVLATGINGIVINAAATDRIVLDGLDIEGFGTGINGVHIIQAGSVVIRRSTIRNFKVANTSACINVATALVVKVSVVDTIINNCDFGIKVAPTAGAAPEVTVQRSEFFNNRVAIRVQGNGILRLSGATVAHNVWGLSTGGSGSIISLGNNVVEGNSAFETPTVTTPLK